MPGIFEWIHVLCVSLLVIPSGRQKFTNVQGFWNKLLKTLAFISAILSSLSVRSGFFGKTTQNQSLFTLAATATAAQNGNKTFSCPRGTRTTTIRTTTTRPQIWKLGLYSAHPQTQGLDSKLSHPFFPHKLLNAFCTYFYRRIFLEAFFWGERAEGGFPVLSIYFCAVLILPFSVSFSAQSLPLTWHAAGQGEEDGRKQPLVQKHANNSLCHKRMEIR